MHSTRMASDPYIAILTPFRRRIRLLRAWRLAAFGGAIGALCSAVLILLDYVGWASVRREWFFATALLGLAAGLAWAVFEKLTPEQIARSVDRRGRLADRLTSAAEVDEKASAMAPALKDDAVTKAQTLDPRALYPVRMGRPQMLLLAAVALATVAYLALNTTLFLSHQGKLDAAKSQQAASALEHIAKPFLAQAQQPGATPEEKALAQE